MMTIFYASQLTSKTGEVLTIDEYVGIKNVHMRWLFSIFAMFIWILFYHNDPQEALLWVIYHERKQVNTK